ncbi:hypothetical protein ACQEVI_18875 [Promicromonospora sp. CA-289599]|uniref:hypothetical protein n=1 Tax=Promicromonospora sp. CA-289599 TaxID=3240014 RepID=UPI003D8B0B8E
MLRRVSAFLALFLSVMMIAPSVSVALPGTEVRMVKEAKCPPPTELDANNRCVLPIVAEDPGSPGGGGKEPETEEKEGSKDSGPVWLTVNGQRCRFEGVTNPQPGMDDPVWEGHAEGVILDCILEVCVPIPDGDYIPDCPMTQVWVAVAPGAPDPAVLAQRAVEKMELRPIDIGIVPEDKPGSIGLVGMPQWMWVNEPGPHTLGPITRSATAGQFTVTATAKVSKTVWDMGDGTSVTCVGPGTVYEDRYDIMDSPDCGHHYTKQGKYEVTATSYWTVEWEGMGQFGTIPVEFASSTNIVMGEAQVITQ